jgi:hypothetical protein
MRGLELFEVDLLFLMSYHQCWGWRGWRGGEWMKEVDGNGGIV